MGSAGSGAGGAEGSKMTRYIPPATQRELDNPVPEGQGQRHNQTRKIAYSLAGNGYSANEIVRMNTNGLPDDEVRQLAEWAISQNPESSKPYNPPKTSNDAVTYRHHTGNGNQTGNNAPVGFCPADCNLNLERFLDGKTAMPLDIGNASPVKVPGDPREQASLLLSQLYQPGELVNIVTEATNEGKPGNRGETLTVTEWLTRFKAGVPTGTAGAWLRMNPLTNTTGVADADVADFRYALVEKDGSSLDMQGAFIMELRRVLPIVAIYPSAGKSLHGLVAVNATDADEYRQTVKELLALLEPFGVDQSNKNPSRLSRLPGAMRGDKMQTLFYLDPDAAKRRLDLTALRTLLATVTTVKTMPAVVNQPAELVLPPALTLDQFCHGVDNGGNLLGHRFLCRAGGLLLAAPTGIGKSSWALQGAVSWSLGLPHLGIRPTGQLRSLFIQAENDGGDIAELRDGIYAGLQLTDEQIDDAASRIRIVNESSKTGEGFVSMVGALVALHQPDLLWIDPLFSYLGADVCNQAAVSTFLRNGLNPVLQKHGCGLILVHHTNKPQKGSEKADWKAGDFAYLGSGTAELANWARAVIGIRSVGEHDVFEMVFGKRGKRAGLVDDWNNPIFSIFIRYSKTVICWELGEAPAGKRLFSKLDVLNLIPATGTISQLKLFNAATDLGIGEKRIRNWLKELEEDEQVFPILTPRPGTNPAKSYSRQRPSGDFGAETLAAENELPKSRAG